MAPTNLFSNLSPSAKSTSPKLHLTTGDLPPHIPTTGPRPSKSHAPFRQIHANPFIAKTTLLLSPSLARIFDENVSPIPNSSISTEAPRALPDATRSSTTQQTSSSTPSQPTPTLPPPPLSAKIHITLTDLLTSTAPLLQFILNPALTITLLSINTPIGIDDSLSLHNGILSLNVSRERYEKMGVPNGVAVKGRGTHAKGSQRWVVSLDLRKELGMSRKGESKMLARWMRAAREVWVERVECWVCVNGGEEEVRDAKSVLETIGAVVRPGQAGCGGVRCEVERDVSVPWELLSTCTMRNDEEEIWALVEWLDLVGLRSERVNATDQVDPFVARYEVPGACSQGTGLLTQDVTVMQWEGLLPCEWVVDLLLRVIRASRTPNKHVEGEAVADIADGSIWAALSISAHQTQAVGNVDGCSIVLLPAAVEGGGVCGSEEKNSRSVGLMNTEREDNNDQRMIDENLDTLDTDSGEKEGEQADRSTQKEERRSIGLRRFMCYQFVDSRTA